jgi:NADH:ubiquinone oxidoreductase subunit 3 (subunit A)
MSYLDYDEVMLRQYEVLAFVAILGIGLFAALWFISRIVQQSARFKPGVSIGMHTKPNEPAPAWRRYHIHYYIFALLFLAFDMEMAFMYPWAVVFRELGLEAFADMGIFLSILFLGLLFAWSQRGLERQ